VSCTAVTYFDMRGRRSGHRSHNGAALPTS
jgi:hypothetical protein